MISWLRRDPVLAALVAACAVLALVIGLEVGLGSTRPPAVVDGANKVASVDTKLHPLIEKREPEQAYPETGARPLFLPTRRPAPPSASGPTTMVKGQYVLQGVTIVGDLRIALLKDKAGKTHRVEIGKEIAGATLAEVAPESVTLRAGEDTEVLRLSVQRLAASAVTAAKATPGPLPTPAAPPGAPAPAAAMGAAAVPAATPATPATLTTPARPGPAASGANPPAAPPAGGNATPPSVEGAPAKTGLTPDEKMMARRAARRAQQAP